MTKKKSSTELPADTMDDSSGLNMKSRSKKRKFEEKSETPTEHHRQKKPRRNKLEQCSETTDDCTVHDVKHKKEKSVEPIQPNCNSDNGVTKLKHHKSKKNKLPLDSSGPPVNSEITLPNSDDVKPVLTPEQKMAKERKRQKMHDKKEKKKQKASADTEESSDDKDSVTKAIEYLKLWKEDRDHWSFQKVRQVWLLKHMYQPDKVPESDFSVLLEYLDGLKGKGRAVTVAEAQKIMDTEEKSSESDADADADADAVALMQKKDRSRQILQLLS